MQPASLRNAAIRLHDRWLGPHELAPAARRAVRRLGAGSLAVDCGANVGRVTALLAARGAEVYAFEPNPFAFEVLSRRFAAEPRVHCLPQAVTGAAGARHLHLHRDAPADQVRWSTGSSLFETKANVDPGASLEVETVDLDAFLAGLGGRVALLKLDVEGAEIEILERLLETGRLAAVEHVLVEMHDRRMPELAARGAALRARLAGPAYRHVQLDWI